MGGRREEPRGKWNAGDISLSRVRNCFSFSSEAGFGVHGFGVEKTRGAGRKRKRHAEGGMLVGRGLRSGKAMLQCYLLFPSFSSPYPLCSTSTIRNPWACEHVPDLQQQRSSPEWTVCKFLFPRPFLFLYNWSPSRHAMMAANIELHAKQHVFESVKVVKKQQAKCLL